MTTITYENREEVEKIYMHDAYFEEIVFKNEYDSAIEIIARNGPGTIGYHFSFQNVIYCEIQSCNFWGAGSNVCDWRLVNDNTTYQKLLAKKEQEHYIDTTLTDYDFFAVQFILITGNTITILCAKIELEEIPVEDTGLS